ncbi:hypothetical protein IE077_003572 [Cardiosporidium cionae]|uniref:Uncharacterized protein n=1 Tax=Cardiosporidium cionae TaxID=476202 RepID=A0ABQ7JET1_9APIC|nr:hypothetical protein IE077_003572 [Cardiosporidium cionae]|eukprot:KAF8822512.1 hypothetical protein IE077_003572 [Cardiosporidium cionae]
MKVSSRCSSYIFAQSFRCTICGDEYPYDYFGKQPPYEAESFCYLEEVYCLRDCYPKFEDTEGAENSFLNISSAASAIEDVRSFHKRYSLLPRRSLCISKPSGGYLTKSKQQDISSAASSSSFSSEQCGGYLDIPTDSEEHARTFFTKNLLAKKRDSCNTAGMEHMELPRTLNFLENIPSITIDSKTKASDMKSDVVERYKKFWKIASNPKETEKFLENQSAISSQDGCPVTQNQHICLDIHVGAFDVHGKLPDLHELAGKGITCVNTEWDLDATTSKKTEGELNFSSLDPISGLHHNIGEKCSNLIEELSSGSETSDANDEEV